ncbi:Exosome complex component RRP42 [Taenia solium]|eukprot:TsM_000232100 transcript=TsM_000232100 gene=TsM_000232100
MLPRFYLLGAESDYLEEWRSIMDNTLISDAERFFIIQGAQVGSFPLTYELRKLGCRLDGRQRSDFRPIEIETGILNHTAGSARVKIGNTIVITCVSIEIGTTSVDACNEGRIEIDVECSPTATPRFSGKSGSDIADTLKATLSTAFTRECLPFKLLCIQPGKQCWVIHADVLLLESAGNLLDAASLAIVAALTTIKSVFFPVALKISAETGDASGTMDFALSMTNLPMFITVHKVGDSYIVDADKEEEACSFARIFVAVRADGTITAIIKEGCGSLRIDSVMDMIEIGQSMGKGMHAALASALQQEQSMNCAPRLQVMAENSNGE